ncbi:MAG: signal peptidase I, partial [Verrucomicrobiota bacterium]
ETMSFSDQGLLVYGEPWKCGDIQYAAIEVADGRVEWPFEVPENSYFLLGDNPQKANDSRIWGAVDQSRIIGKVEK